jgi:PEP-CTERM motif
VVLIIETDATHFSTGKASVIDGEATTVDTLGPTGSSTPVPEPNSLLLLGAGLLAVSAIRLAIFVRG